MISSLNALHVYATCRFSYEDWDQAASVRVSRTMVGEHTNHSPQSRSVNSHWREPSANQKNKPFERHLRL